MRRTGWGPWAGLRQPWQTDADAWGAASKPCWGENTIAVSKPLRPPGARRPSQQPLRLATAGGSGGSLTSPPHVGGPV